MVLRSCDRRSEGETYTLDTAGRRSQTAANRQTPSQADWESEDRQINRPRFEDRAPGIPQRGQRLIYGNPDVRPTRSWGRVVGAEHHTGDRFPGANLFHQRVRDAIEANEISTNTPVARPWRPRRTPGGLGGYRGPGAGGLRRCPARRPLR